MSVTKQLRKNDSGAVCAVCHRKTAQFDYGSLMLCEDCFDRFLEHDLEGKESLWVSDD